MECGGLAPLCYWFVFKDQSGGKPPHSKEAHNPNSTITLQAVLMVGYNLRALKSRSTRRDINMKRFLAVAIITLAASLPLSAQEHSKRPPVSTPSSTPPPISTVDANGWVKFTSEAGHFSVMMPETPTDKEDTVQSPHGPYTTHLFVVKDEQSVYLIGWVDYDPAFNFDRKAELEANRDNFVKGINATLLSTRTTNIDGYSALEFSAETADRVFKSRVYMVGRRPYQIVIGSPKGLDDSVSVNRFFNSFKISP